MTATDGKSSPRKIVRSRDQLCVAALTAATVVAQLIHWGLRGSDWIDIDQAPQLSQHFSLDPNSAEWPEWTLLPGVGPTLAQRIVEFRQTEGPFRTADDLSRVRGIGAKKLESMRAFLLPPSHLRKGQ